MKLYIYACLYFVKDNLSGVVIILPLGVLMIESVFYRETCISVEVGKYRLKEYGSGSSYLIADILDQDEVGVLKLKKTSFPRERRINVIKRKSLLFDRISYEFPLGGDCSVMNGSNS